MHTEFVTATVADHIAEVTMQRPPVNATNLQLYEELAFVFDRLSLDDATHVIILTGHGHVFCAGADLKEVQQGSEASADLQRLRAASAAFFAILGCRKPTIAAINGPALGAGAVLVASCDILIASDNAFLALPEVGVGLLGGARHVMRLLGQPLTRRMMLSGYHVSAAELYRIGVIANSLPTGQLLPAARDIAHGIASKDPVVVQLAKRALNDTEVMGLRDGYAHEQALTLDILRERRSS